MNQKRPAFLSYLSPSKGLVALSVVFASLSVVSKLAIPFLAGKAIDLIRSGLDNPETLQNLAVILYFGLGFCFLGMVFRYAFDYVTSQIGERLVKTLRDEAYSSLLRVPVSYLDTHPHGDLLARLTTDVENVKTGLVTGVGALYEGIVQILITIGFMFAINYLLALVVVLLTPISIFVSRFISSHNAQYFKEQNARMGQINAFGLETISSLGAIQSYGIEGARKSSFSSLNDKARKASFAATFAATWINPCTRLVNNIIYGSIVMIGVALLLTSPSFIPASFSVGGLTAFLTYSNQYMTPFNEIADAMGEVLVAKASFARVEEAILAPKDVDEGTLPLGETVTTLKAENITFGYDSSRSIIKDFSLDIYSGHKIALVGTTGCGKTTIINLLMRFYDPQVGGFLMNGIPTQKIAKKEMRSHIGMVLQDAWLAKATIFENIAFGKEGATKEEVVAAAKKAHADDFIRQLPQGYDTVISSDSGLSTGQKQLLCVARILLLAPEIVLLDEATSNIDLRTELLLSGAFDELMKGKTSIVVAHRLSTIQNADLILVMNGGKIQEQGNFRELMEKNGLFAELYRSQFA
ncbi:MAG: ABC transporter ATP-binding protein [Candidatus Enteromonas sp.]|nr:ABC transporter ATP-binding protein [Candidatus Enteromonas sp.]